MSVLDRLGLASVWSRLLATMAVVVAPAAALIVLLAFSLYRSALANFETTEATAAAARAAAARAWLDAAGRSLASETFAARNVMAERCVRLAEDFLSRNPGFSALRLHDESLASCTAGEAVEQADLPQAPDAGHEETEYRLAAVGARLWIIAGAGAPGLLLVDDKALSARLHPVTAMGETHIALLTAKGDVIAAYPNVADGKWAPATATVGQRPFAWRAADRSGASAAFSSAPVDASGLRVLMRFDDRRFDAARNRFILLCLAQLGMLGMLAYVYAATIRRDVVHWIQGLDVAARARRIDPESRAKAPTGAAMPRELRSVAESFNAMLERESERQRAMRSAIQDNHALMLEMHHRIKNSLQVIQSYLALIRRSSPPSEVMTLARVEARVVVLAVAYRLALTPNGVRPIAIKPFLDEISAAAIAGLRRPRQRAAYSIAEGGEVVVDRAIPLGLGLVEALVAAFGAIEAGYIGVRLFADESGAMELRVESDAAPAEMGLPEKVMRGLANQLGAEDAAGPGDILAWRFRP